MPVAAPSLMDAIRAVLEPAGIPFALEPLDNGLERVVFSCGCAFGYEGAGAKDLHVYRCRPGCPLGEPLIEVVLEAFPDVPVQRVDR